MDGRQLVGQPDTARHSAELQCVLAIRRFSKLSNAAGSGWPPRGATVEKDALLHGVVKLDRESGESTDGSDAVHMSVHPHPQQHAANLPRFPHTRFPHRLRALTNLCTCKRDGCPGPLKWCSFSDRKHRPPRIAYTGASKRPIRTTTVNNAATFNQTPTDDENASGSILVVFVFVRLDVVAMSVMFLSNLHVDVRSHPTPKENRITPQRTLLAQVIEVEQNAVATTLPTLKSPANANGPRGRHEPTLGVGVGCPIGCSICAVAGRGRRR